MERVGSAVTCYRVCCLSWNYFDLLYLSYVHCLQDITQELIILCQLIDKAAYIMQWLATTPIVYNLGAKVMVVVEEEEEEEVKGQVTTTTSRQYTTTSSSELTSHWRYGWDYYYSVQWQCQWFSQSISIQNIILRSFITFFMHRYCPKCGPWLSYDGSIWDGFTSSATSTLHQDQCQSYQ